MTYKKAKQMTYKKAIVLGGGTFSHVRNHMALAAPAFGKTARRIQELFDCEYLSARTDIEPHLFLTKMADPLGSSLVTSEDVSLFVDEFIDANFDLEDKTGGVIR